MFELIFLYLFTEARIRRSVMGAHRDLSVGGTDSERRRGCGLVVATSVTSTNKKKKKIDLTLRYDMQTNVTQI